MTEPDEPPRPIDDLIDAVPWGRLTLAYDFALDAPARLRSQVGASVRDPEFDHWLFSAVTHQGTPYSATAPVLWILRRIVDAEPGHPALASCLETVAICTEALAWRKGDGEGGGRADDMPYGSAEGEPLWSTPMPPDFVPVPAVDGSVSDAYFVAYVAHLDTLAAAVEDWHGVVADSLTARICLDEAIGAGCAIMQLWPAGPVSAALIAVVRDEDVAAHRRAGALIALSRAGHDVEAMVGPTDRVLQVAMALGQPGRAGALDVLIGALRRPPWLSAALPQEIPGAESRLLSSVVTTVLDRVPADKAGPALVEAMVELSDDPSGPLGASAEWDPVLAWAFPERVEGIGRDVPLPTALSPLQTRLLAALVGNDHVWPPSSGFGRIALRRVGLPHDRDVIADLVGITPR